MARALTAFCLSLALAPAPSLIAATGNVDLPRYPSISPDGTTIAFTWRGDIWSVPAAGGIAQRLTSHPASDLRTAWSGDGTRIAFNSARLGGMNIFIMNSDGTGVTPLTQSDRQLILSGFTADSRSVLCSAAIEGDVYRAVRPYTVSVESVTTERLLDCFAESPQESPDGTRIVFERGGSEWSRRNYRGSDNRDLWLYDRNSRAFTRITTWEGNDGKPRWRDNSTIVFLSDRELDTTNLYTMTLTGGEKAARRLTSFTGNDIHDFDVSRDGSTCVCSAWDTLYTLTLSSTGAAPRPVTITAPEDEADNFALRNIAKDCSAGALNPDGKSIAVIAYGQVYVRSTDEKAVTRRVSTTQGRCREPAWSPDGTTLYFAGDEDGSYAIYAATVQTTRDDLKDALKKPAADAPGADKPEPKPDAPDPAKQAERWATAIRFNVAPVGTGRTGGIGGVNDRRPTPAPDGKSLAFRRGRGDIVILDLATGATRTILESWDYENEFRFSPDGRFIAYATSDDNFNADIWVVPSDASHPPVNVTRHPDIDTAPRWSADGKVLAFLSERRGDFDVYAVYLDKDMESLNQADLEKYYKDAADAAKKRKPLGHDKKKDDKKPEKAEKPGADQPVTTEPAPGPPADAPKGEADKPADAEKKPEPETKPAPPPFEPSLDDAYLRVRRITSMPGNEGNLEVTPAGDRFVFTGNNKGDGGEGLFSIKWTADDKDRKRLADGSPEVQGLSLTGDKVVYVDKGAVSLAPVEGGKVEAMPIDDTPRIDLKAQSTQKFIETARVLGELFYHPTMKGLDWKALTDRYLTLANQSRTGEEFAYVGMRLVGELNASHLGVYPPAEKSPLAETVGRLGINVQPAAAPDRVYLVKGVVPRGPSSTGPGALREGDIITAIDFKTFGPADTLDALLRGKVGKEVAVTIRRAPAQDAERIELTTLLVPISYEAETDLRYQWWVRRNTDLVNEVSQGKLGYLHIRSMSEPALFDFERDLYAAAEGKAGLLIDVRNNGGGSTADLVLASIMARPHAYTVPRGATPNTDAYPRDRLFIQRYTKPVNMLCNEKSFSNAEIISHAFKTLQRGRLCGQRTYGGVISTDATQLIDGTTVRLPFRGWYLHDGTDMENHGAIPDLLIDQTPEDETTGTDRQLIEAVRDLLQRVN